MSRKNVGRRNAEDDGDFTERHFVAGLPLSLAVDGNCIAEGPVVVSFYRGEWCPFCNIELRGLQEALPKMQKLGATLVAICPEKLTSGWLRLRRTS